ncbi:MAG: threonine/serine exporter family protein [Candidatus Cloacimonetes bacterium]|nr:threonine/serine exporter family protein [Candidatus Cloacimonadota bacterium]
MSTISLQQCSKLALETGRVILESGGATNRVELMMHKVCTGLGYPDCESFVTPTGIFLSISDGDTELSTRIKRIDQRRMDLGRITEVSRIVNFLYTYKDDTHIDGKCKRDYFKAELARVKDQKTYPMWLSNLCGAGTSGFFCLLFGGSWTEFLVALVVGFLVATSLKYISRLPVNSFLLNALAAALIVLISKTIDIWVPFLRLDFIIIGGIMILVPGLQIVNAIRDTMSGDLVAGTARGVEAIIITTAIVAGSGAMLKLWEILS